MSSITQLLLLIRLREFCYEFPNNAILPTRQIKAVPRDNINLRASIERASQAHGKCTETHAEEIKSAWLHDHLVQSSLHSDTHTVIQFVEFTHSFKCTTLNHEAGVKLRLAIGSEVGLLLVHHKY